MAELIGVETEIRLPIAVEKAAKENRQKILDSYPELKGYNPERIILEPVHIENLGEDTALAVVGNTKGGRRKAPLVQMFVYAPEKFAKDGEKIEIVVDLVNGKPEPFVPEVRDGEMLVDYEGTQEISMAEKMFIREIAKNPPTEPLTQEQLIDMARAQVRKALGFQMRRELSGLSARLEMKHITDEIVAGIVNRAELEYEDIENARLGIGRLAVVSENGFIQEGIVDGYWESVNAVERLVSGKELAGKVIFTQDEEDNIKIGSASLRRPDTGEDLSEGNSVLKKFLEERLPERLARRIVSFDKLHLKEDGESKECWLGEQDVEVLWSDLYQESLKDWLVENRSSFQDQFSREILPDKSPFLIPSELSKSLRNLSLNSRRTDNTEALKFKALREDERKLTVNFDFQGTDFQIILDPKQEEIQITNVQSEVERSVLLQALFSSNPEISKEDLRVYERRAVHTGLEKLRQGKLMIKENDLLLTDMDLEKKPDIALSEDILFFQNGFVSRFRQVDGNWYKQDGKKWREVMSEEASNILTIFRQDSVVLPEENETINEFAELDLSLEAEAVDLGEEIDTKNSNAIFSNISAEVNRLLTEEEKRDVRATDYIEAVTARDLLELSAQEQEKYKKLLAARKVERIREKLKID